MHDGHSLQINTNHGSHFSDWQISDFSDISPIFQYYFSVLFNEFNKYTSIKIYTS